MCTSCHCCRVFSPFLGISWLGEKFVSSQKQKMGQKLTKNSPEREKKLEPSSVPQPSVCCICFEDLSEANFILNEECQHSFCHDCGKKWIQSEIDLFSTGEIRCPSHNECQKKLTLMNLSLLLPNEEYEKLVNRQVEHLLTTNPSYHHCSASTTADNGGKHRSCPSVFQYDDEDPSYCQDFYEIGDEVFFFGKSSYQMTPGTVVGKRSGKYDVQDFPQDSIPNSYFVSGAQMKPVWKILRIGIEVEYAKGAHSFFNRPKSYLISAVHPSATSAAGAARQNLYDLHPIASSPSEPVLGVSYHHIGLSKSQYLHSQHRHRCPQCHSVVCMKCNVLHPIEISCEEFTERARRDEQNIHQMTRFRQEFLQQLSSGDASKPTPSAAKTTLEAEEKEFLATLTLLNELEVRICKKCHNGVCKSSGCDKLMCRCGYKFCYHCGVENALCQCTPSNHYYIDNVNGGATP
jgi:hypothetical protein